MRVCEVAVPLATTSTTSIQAAPPPTTILVRVCGYGCVCVRFIRSDSVPARDSDSSSCSRSYNLASTAVTIEAPSLLAITLATILAAVASTIAPPTTQ